MSKSFWIADWQNIGLARNMSDKNIDGSAPMNSNDMRFKSSEPKMK